MVRNRPGEESSSKIERASVRGECVRDYRYYYHYYYQHEHEHYCHYYLYQTWCSCTKGLSEPKS